MSLYQLNFLQLAQKLRQEAGISGSGPTTTVGQTGELGRVCDWILQSYNDIQERHDDWGFMRNTFSLPLTIGQSVYPYNINNSNPSNTTSYPLSNLADVRDWKVDSFRCYLYGTLNFISNSGISAGDTITGSISGATAFVINSNYPKIAYIVNHKIVSGNTITGAISGATGRVSWVDNNFIYFQPLTGTFVSENITNGSGGIAEIVAPVIYSQSNGSSLSIVNTNGIFQNETVTNGTGQSAVVSGPVLNGFNDEQWIVYIEWDLFRDTRLRNANRFAVGRPIEFSIDPQKNLVVWPIPSDVYTVDGEYFKLPQTLINDTDYPVFPDNHMVIVYNALIRYAGWVEGSSRYSTAKAEYNRLIRKLEKSRMPQISAIHPIA